MYAIICEDLRNKYDMFLWNERKGNDIISNDYQIEMIEELDDMQEKFFLSTSVKLLLFDLAEKGQVISENQLQVKIIEEVLEESGYTFEIKELNT